MFSKCPFLSGLAYATLQHRTNVQVENESWQNTTKFQNISRIVNTEAVIIFLLGKWSMFTRRWQSLRVRSKKLWRSPWVGETMSKHKQQLPPPHQSYPHSRVLFRFSSSSSCYSGVQLSTETVVVVRVLARLHAGPRLSHPDPLPHSSLSLCFSIQFDASWADSAPNRTKLLALLGKGKKTFCR